MDETFDQHGSTECGERARILLAKHILQGANLLVLDEPTNDLDLLTMRALEEALMDFPGGVIVVTHDRAFLDRICTDILSFEGDGNVGHYADRTQAMRKLKEIQKSLEKKKEKQPITEKAKPKDKEVKRSLTFKERFELEELLTKIDDLETEITDIESKMCEPDFYKSDSQKIASTQKRLSEARIELDNAMERWEYLSEFE